MNAWRWHPSIRPTSIFDFMPGLGGATVAFAAFLGYQWLTAPSHRGAHHEHEGGHEAHGKPDSHAKAHH